MYAYYDSSATVLSWTCEFSELLCKLSWHTVAANCMLPIGFGFAAGVINSSFIRLVVHSRVVLVWTAHILFMISETCLIYCMPEKKCRNQKFTEREGRARNSSVVLG